MLCFQQNNWPDSEYSYELFSVIIHKGGCYGGHYHVYIKDIDQLGHWEAPVSLLFFIVVSMMYGTMLTSPKVTSNHYFLFFFQEEEVKVKAKTQRQEDKVGERKKESERSVDTEDPLSVLTDILSQVCHYTIKLYNYARL